MRKQKRSIEEVKLEVEKYLKSGLSKREYCEKTGMKFHSLQWMHTRLKRHEKLEQNVRELSGFTCYELPQKASENTIKIKFSHFNIELPETVSEKIVDKLIKEIRYKNV